METKNLLNGKNKKRRIETKLKKGIFMFLVGTIVIGMAASAVSGVMLEKNLNEIIDESDYIVIASVKDINSIWESDKGTIYTDVTIVVEKAIKENSTEKIQKEITVKMKGGQVGNLRQWVEHESEFASGEKVLLFLNKKNPFIVNSHFQGKYTIERDRAINKGLKRNINVNEFINAIQQRTGNPTYNVENSLKENGVIAATTDTIVTTSSTSTCYSAGNRWQGNTVKFYRNLPSDWHTAVNNGAEAWNCAANFTFLDYGNKSKNCPSSDGYNVNCMGTIDDSGGILAQATWTSTSSDGGITWWVVEADTRFDSSESWYTGTGSCPYGKADLWGVAAHEFGHWLSLNHPPDTCTEETMYAFTGYAETKKRDIHDGDIAGINYLYGNPPDADSDGVPDNCDVCPGFDDNGDGDGDGYNCNIDCNDTNDSINPRATDITDNGIDENCNGYDNTTYYRDLDSDTYGNATDTTGSDIGSAPPGYLSDDTDCNDNDDTIHPGALDICENDIDEDCNGSDTVCPANCDADGDGYDTMICSGGMDCDDTNDTIHPGAADISNNGIDENCNGYDNTTYYRDSDGDSYGNATDTTTFDTGSLPPGYSSEDTDCNDNNNQINPGAADICNGIDDNCDGSVDGCSSCYECNQRLKDASCTVVTLALDISSSGTCIDLSSSATDKTFNCNGHIISGDGTGYGIYIPTIILWPSTSITITNFTIRNCEIDNFNSGVYLQVYDQISCSSVNLTSHSNKVINNTFIGNTNGVLVTAGGYRIGSGVVAEHNNISYNNFISNSIGVSFSVSGSGNSNYFCGNTNHKGYINNNVVSNNKFSLNDYGIRLYASGGSQVENNVVVDNLIFNNIIKLNSDKGIYLYQTGSGAYVQNNNLVNNGVCSNGNHDIYISGSTSNSGYDNICDTGNWNDDGTTGCSYICPPCEDNDGDGYGVCPACNVTHNCDYDGNDCDDSNSSINPDADDTTCDGIDDDCDGTADEDYVSDESCFLPGVCAAGNSGSTCVAGVETACSTGTPATETCNGIDDDCDGSIDEGVTITFYRDADADNYGDPADTIEACTQPSSYVLDNNDCDDNNPSINPGAEEVCDNLDNNCNGNPDEGCDDDNDFYCDASMTVIGNPHVCQNGGNDCNDDNISINPGTEELYNGVDDNCNGEIDEGYCTCSSCDDCEVT